MNNPDQDDPNPRIVLLKLQDATQLMHLEMQNTSIAWDVANFQISTIAGQPDYLIPISAEFFGHDFRVMAVDPSNRYFAPWEIRRCDMGDNDNFYNGPAQSGSSGHSAVVANFYRQGEAIFLRLVPSPGEGGKLYEIWYETASQGMTSLADSPTIAPFQRFRNIRAALALLPYCRWSGIAPEMMIAQAQAISSALVMQAVEHKKAWDDWIATDREDGVTERLSYAAGCDSYGYY